MEPEEYRLLTKDPGVFRREELTDTIRWLGDSLPNVVAVAAELANLICRPLLTAVAPAR